MKTATIDHKEIGEAHASIVERDGFHQVYASNILKTVKLGCMIERHVESNNGLAHFLREHPLVQGFEVNV